MVRIGIIGGGPSSLIPDLSVYRNEIDIWIGADRGALTLADNNMQLDYAVGDFDSITEIEKQRLKQRAKSFEAHPVEKDQTDLEIALGKAYDLQPEKIYLFGVTGGRLDHALINIQLLFSIVNHQIQGIIVDKQNQLELTFPGEYNVTHNDEYPNISFVPYSRFVKGLTLNGFYYPLTDQTVSWGSTLCISNKLLSNNGTFSYEEGILLLIKSRDAISGAIPM
ncbi:thiamine diphosphokinase [Virgibacillus doumboii]|uniref:thiamine diphosphokinase n=1 Tax=Virgibacillus doumboii TaxID=2697503 RepID=UPI0013E01356|nr:thiamine diphosphokinase [Virgibacillus doumboii]